MRLPRSIFLALPIAGLAACGDNLDDASGADLANADAAHLRRAFDVASGADAVAAARQAADLAAAGDATSCPRVERTGTTTILRGGCDGANGPVVGLVVLDGSEAMARATFEGYGDGTRTVDGVIAEAVDGGALTAELTVVAAGIPAFASLDVACDGVGLCAVDPGAWIHVDGLGDAEVAGAWRLSPPGGYLTLLGAQTVTFDLNATDPAGCVPVTIDGAPHAPLCP